VVWNVLLGFAGEIRKERDVKKLSGYRVLFAALPESGAGPQEWTDAECRRVQQALRQSGVFKQTWLRAAIFCMLSDRLQLLQAAERSART
jgi:hypothetical protein